MLADQLAFAVANGISSGMAIFLVAAGVTIIFGLLRILNFAHGSFFMLGAYVAFTLVGKAPATTWGFIGAAVVAGIAVGLVGLATEVIVFRRLRKVEDSYSLIATFALMMLFDGGIKLVWGLDYTSIQPPPALNGVFILGPIILPFYSIVIMALGLAVFVGMEVLLHRLWVGKVVQTLAHDQWMAGYVGINVPIVLTCAVVAAFFLAGFAGGLLLPNQTLSPSLSHAFLLDAFIAVIIGGLGNIRGAFVAALGLGIVESLNAVVLPDTPGIASYLMMILFMLWRPGGVLAGAGQPSSQAAHVVEGASPAPGRMSPALTAAGIAGAIALATLPLWAGPGPVFLAGLGIVAALFSLSWNLLFGTAGLASFGHAAFLALGGYFCAVGLRYTGGHGFLPILLGAAVLGAAVAAVVGFIAVRRTAGIALGILTLALSEIMRIMIVSSPALGRDDGISGIVRPNLELGFATISLGSGPRYFWFLLVVSALLAGLLRWLTAGRFGRVLRAIRQDAERTAFLGIRVARYRTAAFVISGAIATVAGALQAPWVQIVTPDSANYLVSMQPMLSSLLGGVSFFWGPVVGTAVFFAVDQLTRSLAGLSELVTGGILLVIVLAAPDGILGLLARSRALGRSAPPRVRPIAGIRATTP
jgi:branched-chain amino acid transport system permease protein